MSSFYITPAKLRMLARLARLDGSMDQKGLAPSQIAMLRTMEERSLVARTHYGSWYIKDAGRGVLKSRDDGQST